MKIKGQDKDKVIQEMIGTQAELDAIKAGGNKGLAAFSTFEVVDGAGNILDFFEFDGTNWNH